MKETEAAELALEDLIRAHMHETPERSPYPTVNLFGPPVFGPGAAAEYAEAERLLDLIGVEVNARVPLGADARRPGPPPTRLGQRAPLQGGRGIRDALTCRTSSVCRG